MGHSVQVPDPEVENLPATQVVHKAEPTGLYSPAGHDVQVELSLFENLPAKHLVQVSAAVPEYVPAAQAIQLLAPSLGA